MAKVIAPLHSIQVRGKCGGVLFRRWRGVNTVSGITGGEGLPGVSQFIAWQAAAASWGSLTAAKMEEWREYAAKTTMERGPMKPKHRSGYIAYSCAAFNAVQCGESAPTGPPAAPAPNFPEGLALAVDGSGDIVVSWDGGLDGDYVQIRGAFNGVLGIRLYDYKLAQQSYTAASAGEWTGPARVVGKRSLVTARVLRDSGQAGPWGRVELVT